MIYQKLLYYKNSNKNANIRRKKTNMLKYYKIVVLETDIL